MPEHLAAVLNALFLLLAAGGIVLIAHTVGRAVDRTRHAPDGTVATLRRDIEDARETLRQDLRDFESRREEGR